MVILRKGAASSEAVHHQLLNLLINTSMLGCLETLHGRTLLGESLGSSSLWLFGSSSSCIENDIHDSDINIDIRAH